jgi:uncharacterized caspase-like protein
MTADACRVAALGATVLTRRRALLMMAGTWAPCGSPLSAQTPEVPRSALVMGNAAYGGAPLANAVNDARLVHQTLKGLSFRSRLLSDIGLDEMLVAIRAWVAESAPAGVRMLYFAGHGAQYRGRNFLLPVDTRLRSEDDLPGAAIDLHDLVDRLSRFDSGVNVVVLDACRSMPAVSAPAGQRWRGPAGGDGGSPGLLAATAPKGTVIAYATAPGAVAADNPRSNNSVYTRHLVQHLVTPGLPIETVFKRTREAVLAASGGTQIPWESSSLVSEFCFARDAAGGCGSALTPPGSGSRSPRP